MAQDIEHIESKLCEYIDGQLDAAGRAEIEKHLASNPSHRQLIEDLKRSRDMLAQLPREQAPAELGETLQSQLERAVLLGAGQPDAAPTALRMSRWPQFLSAAAIVLLSIGLGAVVYFVLPKNERFAIAPSPSVPPTLAPRAQPATVADADETRKELRYEVGKAHVADRTLARPDAKAYSANKDTFQPIVNQKPAGGYPSKLGLELGVPAGLDLYAGFGLPADARQFLAGAITPPAGQTVVLTIATNDLDAANAEVVRFLDSNRIGWSAEDAAEETRDAEHRLAGAAGLVAAPNAGDGTQRTDSPTTVPAAVQVAAVDRALSLGKATANNIDGMKGLSDGRQALANGPSIANASNSNQRRVILARKMNGQQVAGLTNAISQNGNVQRHNAAYQDALVSQSAWPQQQAAQQAIAGSRNVQGDGLLPATQPMQQLKAPQEMKREPSADPVAANSSPEAQRGIAAVPESEGKTSADAERARFAGKAADPGATATAPTATMEQAAAQAAPATSPPSQRPFQTQLYNNNQLDNNGNIAAPSAAQNSNYNYGFNNGLPATQWSADQSAGGQQQGGPQVDCVIVLENTAPAALSPNPPADAAAQPASTVDNGSQAVTPPSATSQPAPDVIQPAK